MPVIILVLLPALAIADVPGGNHPPNGVIADVEFIGSLFDCICGLIAAHG